MSDPKAEPELIAQFLRRARPDGQFVIAAIPVEGGPPSVQTFDDADAAASWAAQRNETRSDNLYWTPNRLRAPANKKPAETDVEELLSLHCDVDPKPPPSGATDKGKAEWLNRERSRILSEISGFAPEPTFIVDSGGGFQAFWRLSSAVFVGGDANRIAELKLYNVELRERLGGDDCQSLEHLMRLPGTVNWPNAKKRERGREPRLAALAGGSGQEHDLAEFKAAECEKGVTRDRGRGGASSRENVRRLVDLAELDQWEVDDRCKMLIAHGNDPDTFSGDRSRVVFDLCCQLVRRSVPDGLIVGIISDETWPISAHVRDQNKSTEYAWRQVERAHEKAGLEQPRVVWSDVELARCLDEAEAALISSGLPVYQMGDRLVQVVTVPRASNDDDSVRRAAGSLVIAPLRKHRLHEHFLTTARFVKVSRGKDGRSKETPYAPPLQFAETYMARHGAWRVPVLTGIATTPTMRADGSVVVADGYDAASGLIIDTQGVAFPPVPEAPSREEGRAALDALVDVVSEFPFVSDDEGGAPGGHHPSQSRSAALAMMITAVARPMFGAAPMFGISAPTMATGKSLLADVPAMIVTGRRATKMSQGASDEEDEKRLLSVLIQGDPVVVIDNIARPIEGDALCTILTEETWRCRLLGRSENRDVGTRALFVATGNNLSFRSDMTSRAVLVSLDSQLENPGERVFGRDLKTYVPENRAELAVAALTVLRCYIAAGRPKITGMAASRFEDWALVRSALMWLGEPDPWATNARVAVGDEARAEHHDLMLAIAGAFGLGEFRATTEIIERSQGADSLAASLHLALATALPHGVSAPGLGRFLKKFSDRRVDGMWIKASPSKKKGGRYAIMSADAAAPGGVGRDVAQVEMQLGGGPETGHHTPY